MGELGRVPPSTLRAPQSPRKAASRRGGGPRGAPSRRNSPAPRARSRWRLSYLRRPRPAPGRTRSGTRGGAAPNQRGGWAGAGRAARSPQLLSPHHALPGAGMHGADTRRGQSTLADSVRTEH